MPGIRNSYQEGSIVRTARAKGPDQWVYRWRETQPDGTVLRRSKIIGDLMHYPTKADAKRLVENFRSELNAATPVERIGSMTVAEAWGHFQANELRDPDLTAHRQRSRATWTTTRRTSSRNGEMCHWTRSNPLLSSGG